MHRLETNTPTASNTVTRDFVRLCHHSTFPRGFKDDGRKGKGKTMNNVIGANVIDLENKREERHVKMWYAFDELEKLENLFAFAISGIDEHLNHDRVEPQYVVGSLLALHDQLHRILEEARS